MSAHIQCLPNAPVSIVPPASQPADIFSRLSALAAAAAVSLPATSQSQFAQAAFQSSPELAKESGSFSRYL